MFGNEKKIVNKILIFYKYFQPLFPETTVKDDDTLKAEIERQFAAQSESRSDQWVLHLQGELQKCPGEPTPSTECHVPALAIDKLLFPTDFSGSYV